MQGNETVDSPTNPYHQICLLLLVVTAIGAISTLLAGLWLADRAAVAGAITLGIAFGVLVSQIKAFSAASGQPLGAGRANLEDFPVAKDVLAGDVMLADAAVVTGSEQSEGAVRHSTMVPSLWRSQVARWRLRGEAFSRRTRWNGWKGTALLGACATGLLLLKRFPVKHPSLHTVEIAAGLALVEAGLSAIAARYLAQVDDSRFRESIALSQAARVVTWVLVCVAASIGLARADQRPAQNLSYWIINVLNGLVCCELFVKGRKFSQRVSSLQFATFFVVGARWNVFGSVLDAAEKQFGIDLRSTWALGIVRRSFEPLLLSLLLLGWFSTCFTVITPSEQGIVERFGVMAGDPRQPGLCVHFPWPMDRVVRVPVRTVQAVQVGHENEEKEGPEDVLWAVAHAPNEYTLLLGNGRDLITVDAAVQYRIVDPRAWRYHCDDPQRALRAIAYRAVMRSTVNLTLSDALSQNVAVLVDRMRAMVQQDADRLGLGVEVLGFTIGGMHPPVPVAPAYEAVVSAQLNKVTAVVDAQVFRIATVPVAESSVFTGENQARAEGLEKIASASGEAWSFRTLESQYRAAPGEYFFRRRLETMEKDLPNRTYTVVDTRFLRDGGELWMTR